MRSKKSAEETIRAQNEAKARYDKVNTKQVHLKLNLKTDQDILKKFEKEGAQSYIKRLVREDIARNGE